MRLPLLILLMVPLAGCTLGTPKTAATPPPPSPQAAPAPAQEAQLSVPQTSVTLPGQQEFNPDSIPKAPAAAPVAPAPEKAEAPPPVRISRRAAAAGPQRTETEAEPDPPAAPAAPAVQEQARIQPVLSDEDLRKFKTNIELRKKEIADRLKGSKGALSAHDKTLADRINSFLSQCDVAEKRGDYSQADALSERALVLAKELSE
jgi:hypothetical protein